MNVYVRAVCSSGVNLLTWSEVLCNRVICGGRTLSCIWMLVVCCGEWVVFVVFFFFFSSRRRHTSSDRDWSSDVCFSDLFPHITDPPDVIADAVGLLIMPGEFAAADFFTQRNRFQHRAIAKASTADVVNFRDARDRKSVV